MCLHACVSASVATAIGNLHIEARARWAVVFHANAPAMLGQNMAHDGQAEAGAAALGGEVRQKELLLIAGGNAAAGVGHQQLHRVGGSRARGHQQSLHERIAHGFGGVVHQVHDHPLELFRIDMHRRKAGREIDAQVDAVQASGENIQARCAPRC